MLFHIMNIIAICSLGGALIVAIYAAIRLSSELSRKEDPEDEEQQKFIAAYNRRLEREADEFRRRLEDE